MAVLVRPGVGAPMLGGAGGGANASSRQCRFRPAAPASALRRHSTPRLVRWAWRAPLTLSTVVWQAACPHSTRHYYGSPKPWALLRSRANGGRVSVYLNRTAFARLANCSRCAATFAAWHASLPPAKVSGHLVGHGKYQRLGP